jgi:hypothetical protein
MSTHGACGRTVGRPTLTRPCQGACQAPPRQAAQHAAPESSRAGAPSCGQRPALGGAVRGAAAAHNAAGRALSRRAGYRTDATGVQVLGADLHGDAGLLLRLKHLVQQVLDLVG